MNEYDKRQLNLMLQKITLYESNKIYFPDLIYDLEGLLNILEEKDSNWKNEFLKYWSDLEIIYALALDNKKKQLDMSDLEIINFAIKNLKVLIKLKLNAYNCETR